MTMAVECSAALPMIATTMMPTKTSVMPNVVAHALDRSDEKFRKQRHDTQLATTQDR